MRKYGKFAILGSCDNSIRVRSLEKMRLIKVLKGILGVFLVRV
jgi:hypothetical protein